MNFVGMAIAAYEIPHINPVKFVQVAGEQVRDPRYNSIHIDQDWFINYIREWQSKTCYTQLWQFNDKIAMYVNAADSKQVKFDLLNLRGEIVYTDTLTTYYTAPGNVIKVGSTDLAARTYVKRYRASDDPIAEGIYVWLVTIDYDFDHDGGVDQTLTLVSEPQSFSTLHLNTSLLEYHNTYNAQDILFAQTGVKFSKRLLADVVDYGVGSNDTDYTDGAENPQTLASTPYRTAKFTTTSRVPEYELDKINRAWSCDRVKIDGKAFVKESGAKFEVSKVARFPKVQAAINIREADARASARGVLIPNVPMYTTPSYPFVINYLAIIGGTTSYGYSDLPVIINDGTEHAAFLTALNVWATDDVFLEGSFSEVGGVVVWTNVGSDLIDSSSVFIYSMPTVYEVNAISADPITIYNGEAIIDWGDGDIEQINSSGYVSSTTHTYSTSMIYTIKVYGYFEKLSLIDPFLDNLDGDIPVGLQYFEVQSPVITAFDCSVLSQADATVSSIILNGGALDTVTNLSSLTLPSIQLLSFAGNALDSTDCDTILDDLATLVLTTAPSGGFVYVNGQTPSAPLTFTGTAAKITLVSHSWHVYND